MVNEFSVTSSVWPSGSACATTAVPSVVPAPGRLSTTTGWPREAASSPASARAATSVNDPGTTGTMRRTVLLGKGACACARETAVRNAAAATRTSFISGAPPEQRDLVVAEHFGAMLVVDVVAEHHDAAPRIARIALLDDLDVRAKRVARTHHAEELGVLDRHQGDNALAEKIAGLGGGERHDQVARADAPGKAAAACIVVVQEHRHFVADQAAEGLVIRVGDGAAACRIARAHLEVLEKPARHLVHRHDPVILEFEPEVKPLRRA